MVAGPFAALAQLPYVAGWLSGAAGSVAAVAAVAGTMAVVVPASRTPTTRSVATTAVAVTTSVSVAPASEVTITVGSTRAPATTSPPARDDHSPIPAHGDGHGDAIGDDPPVRNSGPARNHGPACDDRPSCNDRPARNDSPGRATTTTATPAPTQLFVSNSHDRSSPVPANGASLNAGEDIYVFAAPSANYVVAFSIDGVLVQTDSAAPYDMMGSNGGGLCEQVQAARLTGEHDRDRRDFLRSGPKPRHHRHDLLPLTPSVCARTGASPVAVGLYRRSHCRELRVERTHVREAWTRWLHAALIGGVLFGIAMACAWHILTH